MDFNQNETIDEAQYNCTIIKDQDANDTAIHYSTHDDNAFVVTAVIHLTAIFQQRINIAARAVCCNPYWTQIIHALYSVGWATLLFFLIFVKMKFA